jgi:hypothetical protein
VNWRLFVGASIIVVGVLLKVGAPPVAIVLGVALAAFLSWFTRRPSSTGRSSGDSR